MLMSFVAVIEDEDDKWENEEFERQLDKKVNNFNFPEGTTAYPISIHSQKCEGFDCWQRGERPQYLGCWLRPHLCPGQPGKVELHRAEGLAFRCWHCSRPDGHGHLHWPGGSHGSLLCSERNQILPLLCIDDMFDNLSTDKKKLTLAKQLGRIVVTI